MKIYDITKCTSGNVLGIGVDEKITEILEQNSLVTNCNLLNSYTKETTKTKTKKQKTKQIRIKKLRKVFKKKKVDFIICNIEEIKKYTKTFIKDSVYINKDMLYIYNIKETELKQELIKKYKRYNTIVEEIKDNETTILKIDNKNSKTNIIKDIFYLIIDTLIQLFNIISDLLLN